MLVTKQKVLRRYWYCVMPLDHLADGPGAVAGVANASSYAGGSGRAVLDTAERR